MNPDFRITRFLPALVAAALALGAPAHAQDPKILSASDVKALNKKARDWFEAWRDYEFASPTPKARRSNNAKLQKAKEAFRKDWDAKSRKADPLASVDDMLAVFAGVFPYERENSSGILKQVKPSNDIPGYWLMVPKRYDAERAYPTVVLLPGFDVGKGSWVDAKDHYDATWGAGGMADDSLCLIPTLDDGLDLDPIPDFSQLGADETEVARLRPVLATAGQVQRDLHVDRARIVLDTGDGASGFAIRLATYFPHRFAGLVLRKPVDVTKDLRLGSMKGMPVLLLSDADTKDACAALAEKLNAQAQGSCTVLEGKGDYPFTGSQAEVEAWVKNCKRELTPLHLTLEPNHDAFNDAYWVLLGATDQVASLAMDQRPRFVVDVDREQNRITIQARGVSDFMLLLNDDIVDLDKEFTIDVNGTLTKEKRSRSLTFLVDQMQKGFDPNWVFTTQYASTITKTDGETPK